MSQPDKTQIINLLAQEWNQIAELCESLTDEQWHAPTECPGWTVKDQISHIIGTEKMLAGDSAPELDIGTPSHVKNDIAAINEKWVEERRSRPPAEVLAEFKEITSRRTDMLEAMEQEKFDAPSWTPAGQDTYARFMKIRLFDCWTHEQDIRQAIDRPGNSSGPVVEEVFAEVSRSMGFVVGKLGGAPSNSRIEFRLNPTMAGQPETVLSVELGDEGTRAAVVGSFKDGASATTTIAMDLLLFLRLTAGRESCEAAVADGRIAISGDKEVGDQIARNLAYVF